MINFLYDEDLSLKAKGLLTLILLIQNDVSIDLIKSHCSDGDTSIKNTLKELEKLGYLKIIKKHENGKFKYYYNCSPNRGY